MSAAPGLFRSDDGRLAAGVCAGLAETFDADVTLVRLAATALALAGGAGIVLYAAAWMILPVAGREPQTAPGDRGAIREAVGVALLLGAGLLVLRAAGLLPNTAVFGASILVAGGLAVIWRRSGPPAWAGGSADTRMAGRWGRPNAVAAMRIGLGAALLGGGVALFVGGGSVSAARDGLLAAVAVTAGAVVVAGPRLWQLGRELDAERTARIRTQERAEVAARVHDSVLQTLALIQRQAEDPRSVTTLARQQERELRGWLYAEPDASSGDELVAAVQAAAAEIERRHGVRIEVAHSGDGPLDDHRRALVLAAREAMTNAAKFAGVDEVAVYVEVGDGGETSIFVRDRGTGFDRKSVPDDRRGVTESIIGRMERHGGNAEIHTTAGAGTEVELTLPAAPG
jgi:signal transduction histidine kinase